MTSTADGMQCYHPDGSLLGKVFVPEQVSNVCFGRPKRNHLFLTESTTVYAVLMPATGALLV